MRDLILSNVPCTELTETYRQKGGSTIIELSKQIRSGKIEQIKSSNDFGFLECSEPQEIVDIFLRGVKDVGVDDIVLLTPQNAGDIGGVRKLNLAIQESLLRDEEVKSRKWLDFKREAKCYKHQTIINSAL